EVVHFAGVLVVEAVAGVAGDEDAMAESDGAGGAAAGELELPGDVFVVGPLGGQVFLAGNAEPAGTAELPPVVGKGGVHGEEEEQKQGVTKGGVQGGRPPGSEKSDVKAVK